MKRKKTHEIFCGREIEWIPIDPRPLATIFRIENEPIAIISNRGRAAFEGNAKIQIWNKNFVPPLFGSEHKIPAKDRNFHVIEIQADGLVCKWLKQCKTFHVKLWEKELHFYSFEWITFCHMIPTRLICNLHCWEVTQIQ